MWRGWCCSMLGKAFGYFGRGIAILGGGCVGLIRGVPIPLLKSVQHVNIGDQYTFRSLTGKESTQLGAVPAEPYVRGLRRRAEP